MSAITERKAKETRCCGAAGLGRELVAGFGNALHDERARGEGDTRPLAQHGNGRYCIASGCMAWRWDRESGGYKDDNPISMERNPATRGFCGLAGHP